MDENELSCVVTGAAIEVHKTLEPGLLINFNELLVKNAIKRLINNY